LETASGASPAATGRVRSAGDFRRDVGGVAQWIPSLGKAGAARVCIVGGRAARGYTRYAWASRES
jgi:hypothetical protein